MSEAYIAWRLTADGDLDLSGYGMTPILEGIDYAEQDIRHTLTSMLGEFFADKGLGVDWLSFLRKEYSQAEVAQAIRAVLLARPYVLEIYTVVSILGTDRSVSIQLDLLTKYGVLQNSQTIGI